MMPLGSDAKVGTFASPISDADGISIDATIDGDKEIKVANDGSIYTGTSSVRGIAIDSYSNQVASINTDTDIMLSTTA